MAFRFSLYRSTEPFVHFTSYISYCEKDYFSISFKVSYNFTNLKWLSSTGNQNLHLADWFCSHIYLCRLRGNECGSIKLLNSCLTSWLNNNCLECSSEFYNWILKWFNPLLSFKCLHRTWFFTVLNQNDLFVGSPISWR